MEASLYEKYIYILWRAFPDLLNSLYWMPLLIETHITYLAETSLGVYGPLLLAPMYSWNQFICTVQLYSTDLYNTADCNTVS